MNEKEKFLQTREREFQTTLKVLRAMPEEKKDTKPGALSKTALELAWVFAAEEFLTQKLLKNEPLFTGTSPEMPHSIGEIIKEVERSHAQTNHLVKEMSEEELRGMTDFFVGPKTPGKIVKMDVLWMMLFDSIHHRGQFSVYLRVAGAKVPSIYGPTADEPWT
jgi:uncharacterized damage-inducible protein DinB